MVLPGLINLDFADVRTVMTEMGKAMMGTGEASGEDRALVAAQNAIANPLLDEISLKGARAVLVNVTGGDDMTLLEVDEAANAISEQVDPEANIIFGAAPDPSLSGKIRVSVVATGMDGQAIAAIEPKPQRVAQPVLSTMAIREPAPERESLEPAAAVAVAEPEPTTPEPAFAPAYAVMETRAGVHPAKRPPASVEPCRAISTKRRRSRRPSLHPRPSSPPRRRRSRRSRTSPRCSAAGRSPTSRVRPRAASSDCSGRATAPTRRRLCATIAATRRRFCAGQGCRAGGAATGRPAGRIGASRTPGEDLEIPSFLRRLAN